MRIPLCSLFVIAFVQSLVFAQDGALVAGKQADMKQLRKEAAHRQRRIIFDNDGDDVVYECKEATPEALLECRTAALAGTQVDTIMYCTWSSGFGCFTHNTKAGEVFTCTAPEPGKGPDSGFAPNKTKAFLDQGTDPLRIMMDFCKKKNIEIFWSMRMNDVHDAWGAWYSPFLFPALKKAHPEWLLGTEKDRPKNGTWTGVDYARPEVRDLAFKFFEEVCGNYDVDGVQLDFWRHLNYFKRPAMGEAASQEDLDMMTDLLRRIRAMADETGLKRGRPILVSVRAPDSVEFSRTVGLDVERWLQEGLVDLLVLTCYFRLNPWETSVELGHKYGVPVYPCLSESRLPDKEAVKVRGTPECYRARAMNVWDAGADGVYMFNFFNPRSPLWRELGSRETLEPLDKVYVTSTRGSSELEYWFKGGQRFMNLKFVTPDNPRKLDPGKPEVVELRVGETLRETTKASLRLRFKPLADADEVEVKFNGADLGNGTKSEPYIEYPVAAAVVKRGTNQIELVLKADTAARPVLEDLQLWVRPVKP